MTTFRWLHDCGFFKIVDPTHNPTLRTVQDAWKQERLLAAQIRDAYEDAVEEQYRRSAFPRLFATPSQEDANTDTTPRAPAADAFPQLPPRLTPADVVAVHSSRAFSFSSLCAYPEVHRRS